jgi:hypothetical protein
MARRKRTTLFVAALLALALAIAGVPAGASTPDDGASSASAIVVAPPDPEGGTPYSAAEIAAAEPMPWPEPIEGAVDGQTVVSDLGEPLSNMAFGGEATARRAAVLAAAEQARAPVGAAPLVVPTEYDSAYTVNRIYTYPPPYTSYLTNWKNMWWDFPWRTIGKLYFQIPGSSGTYSCSASVVNRRMVITAGHCVYSPGSGWHTNMWFHPGYRSGYSPYGAFQVYTKASLSGWTSSGNQAYDIGMMITNPDGNGNHVGQVVGWLGFWANGPAQVFWHANGYPGAYAGGNILMVCEGSLSSRWALSGTDPMGMGCNMQWGSSGGPWIAGFEPYAGGACNYVNSVVSGSPNPSNNHEFFGPYFGNGAVALWNWGIAY